MFDITKIIGYISTNIRRDAYDDISIVFQLISISLLAFNLYFIYKYVIATNQIVELTNRAYIPNVQLILLNKGILPPDKMASIVIKPGDLYFHANLINISKQEAEFHIRLDKFEIALNREGAPIEKSYDKNLDDDYFILKPEETIEYPLFIEIDHDLYAAALSHENTLVYIELQLRIIYSYKEEELYERWTFVKSRTKVERNTLYIHGYWKGPIRQHRSN